MGFEGVFETLEGLELSQKYSAVIQHLQIQ